MAVAGSDVSNFNGLNFAFFNVTQAALVGANAVPHGLSITPNCVVVVPLDGLAVVSAISVDATSVNFTSTTAGNVTILCF